MIKMTDGKILEQTIEQTIENLKEMSKKILTNLKFVSPVFFPISDRTILTPIFLDFSSEEKKDATITTLKTLLTKTPQIKGYLLITENWQITAKKETPKTKPSTSPDRKECLTCTTIMRDGSKKIIITPFNRTETGIIIFDKEITIENNDVQGEFATLFRGEK